MKKVLVGVAAALLLAACSDSPEERAQRDCDSDSMAYIMSRKFMERELRSPSTAKFPSFSDAQVTVLKEQACKFKVYAYVDSQNGFGAIVRSYYTIDMEYLPVENTWRGSGLKLL